VAKEIELRDPLENMGGRWSAKSLPRLPTLPVTARPPRPCSRRPSSARASRLSPPAASPTALKRGIEKAVEVAVAEIQKLHKDVKGDMIAKSAHFRQQRQANRRHHAPKP